MKIVPLTDICDFQGGTQPPKNEWSREPSDKNIRMLQIRDFTQPEKDNIEYVRKTKNLKLCNADDILVGRYGASVGKILTGLDGAYNVAIIKTIPNESVLSKKFLFHLLKGPKFQSFINAIGARAAQAGFNKTDLSKFTLPLLPIDDQIRIATLLSHIETLITKRKDNLRLLGDFLKSTFLEMFGPTNPDFKNWPITEIKELAAGHKSAMRTGPFGSNLLHKEFSETGDVAVLGIDNAVENKFTWGQKRFITKEKYENLRNYRIFPGDVIITIMGTIGRSAVVPEDIPLAINTKHLAAITLDTKKANPKFLSYSIHSSPYITRQFAGKNRGAIMNGLNLGIIKETKLRKPPVELQNHFASIVAKVDSLKILNYENLKELENLYGTLSQKAFKGELDLSRIPLPAITANGHITAPLPSIRGEVVTGKVMSHPKAREKLLRQIFENFIAYKKDIPFCLEEFWPFVEEMVLDHTDENSPPLGIADYDQIKVWLFNLLESGGADQQFNEESNLLELSVHP